MQEIDSKYMKLKKKGFIFKGVLREMFEEVIIEDSNLKENDRTKVYVPNHKSLLDFIFLSNYFLEKGKPPYIIGGSNLLIPGITSNPALLVNLEKCGLIRMPRNFRKQREEGTRFTKDLTEILEKGEDFMVFAEGGRSYEGEMKELKDGILKKIFNGKQFEVVPISLSYEVVAEAKLFPGNKGLKRMTKYAGTIIMLKDLFAFGTHYFSENKGNLYIDFGESELVSEHENHQSLCKKLHETMAKNVRVTATSLVAYSMTEEPETIEELYKIVEEKLQTLSNKPMAQNIKEMSVKEITDRGLQFLAAVKDKQGKPSVKEHLFSYYASHIQHYFMSPRTS